MELLIDGHRLPARDALVSAIADAWERLARPGTWWTGGERIAVAAEVRAAQTCRLCRARREALSPYALDGAHDIATTETAAPHAGSSVQPLNPEAIEAIHRLATDAGRITERWVREMCDGPLGEERYVELVALVAIVTGLDTFDHALGRSCRALPAPVAGAPSLWRPVGAKRNLAWVATLAPEDVSSGDPNPYPVHGDKNIHRAVSLVPQSVIDFFDLDVELYLKDHEIRDFSREYREITHAQIELIAARVSAINQCFY